MAGPWFLRCAILHCVLFACVAAGPTDASIRLPREDWFRGVHAGPGTDGSRRIRGETHVAPALRQAGLGQSSGQQSTIQVFETTIEIPSSLGGMSQKCLTLVSDPSQSFCATFLNGQYIGPDAGLAPAAIPLPSEDGVSTRSSTGSRLSTSLPGQAGDTTTSTAVVTNVTAATEAVVPTPTTSPSLTSPVFSIAASTDNGSLNTTSTDASSTDIFTIAAVSDNGSTVGPTATPTTSSTVSSTPSFVLFSSTTDSALQSPSAVSSSPTIASADSTPASLSPTGSSTLASEAALTSLLTSAGSAAASAAAANAQASANTTAIPGQKLQVLPIGLGIFGGLVVVTLCIVGYVMYERRKYKLQFRRRKDQEHANFASQGASMGYT